MTISVLHLDDHVVIPKGRKLGEDTLGELRASSFLASDGWVIRETLVGVFSLSAPWLPEPVTIGGYSYSYTVEPPAPVVEEVATPPKGKKR